MGGWGALRISGEGEGGGGSNHLDPSAGLCLLPASGPLELSFIVFLFPPVDWGGLELGVFPELMLAFAAMLAEDAMMGKTGVASSYSGQLSCQVRCSLPLVSEAVGGEF